MKLPSLQTLWENAYRTFSRFPIQCILAISSAIIWCYWIDADHGNLLHGKWIKILLASNFALTLLLSTDLFCEARSYPLRKKWVLRVIALAIAVTLYFAMDPILFKTDVFRFFLLAFAFHLLVAFAPFINQYNLNGFWQYNKTLFLRFLTAAFYGLVLYAGLAIALLAIDNLFSVEINYKAYSKLFAIVGAGFITIFFLAGVPTNLSELDEDQSYPKGLKIFTQYVLLPLMTVYLAILLVYEIKIAIIWTLPKGIVSSLILGYAVFGILSLLLIYPIKNKEGNAWMKLFSRFFYFMMIPLIVLLILAIIKRVSHYGITEARYILMMLAIWLTFISIYFLMSKKQNIKVIPVTLFILALISTYGPQSAVAVAKNSQLTRLKKLLNNKDKQSMEEQPRIISYLVTQHGLTSLQQFTTVNLAAVEERINSKSKNKYSYDWEIRSKKIDTAFAILKIEEKNQNISSVERSKWFRITNTNKELINIKGYDVVYPFSLGGADSTFFDGVPFHLELKVTNKKKAGSGLTLTVGKIESMSFDVEKIYKEAHLQYREGKLKSDHSGATFYPAEKMQFEFNAARYQVKLIVTSMNGEIDQPKNDFNLINVTGYLIIKKK